MTNVKICINKHITYIYQQNMRTEDYFDIVVFVCIVYVIFPHSFYVVLHKRSNDENVLANRSIADRFWAIFYLKAISTISINSLYVFKEKKIK